VLRVVIDARGDAAGQDEERHESEENVQEDHSVCRG